MQWHSQAQAVHLYQDAGFEEVHVYRSFSWEPAAPEEREYFVVGVK